MPINTKISEGGYERKRAARLLRRCVDRPGRQCLILARSVVDPFKAMLAELSGFRQGIASSLLNPRDQQAALGAQFERDLELALSGNLEAIERLAESGQAFIDAAGQFGASPALVKATDLVARGIADVESVIKSSLDEATIGIEDVVALAERQLDNLSDLVRIGQSTRRSDQGVGQRYKWRSQYVDAGASGLLEEDRGR